MLSSLLSGSVAGRGGLPLLEGSRRFSFSTEEFESRSDFASGAGASWPLADWVMSAERASEGVRSVSRPRPVTPSPAFGHALFGGVLPPLEDFHRCQRHADGLRPLARRRRPG